jgi:hypothetical protein
LPVVILTLLYNIPKFFELYVREDMIKTCFNGTDTYNITINVNGLSINDCDNGTLVMVKQERFFLFQN